MKTIAIIPARGGSKRLPNKNTLELGGIPLLAHSILYAKANDEIIDHIYVSTDSLEIKEIALQYGAKVVDRPPHLSGDKIPTIDVLAHVVDSLHDSNGNVILLQPTNPLRPKNLLKETYHKFITNNLESLFTVSRNHQKFGTIKNSKFSPFNYFEGQRSQDLEPLFYENGLLYIAKTSMIIKGLIMGANCFPLEVDHPFSKIDIDTQEDFDLAEFMLKKYTNE